MRLGISASLLGGLLLATTSGQPASNEARPSYRALKSPTPVVVDGRLDDPVWKAVPPVGPFVNNRDGSASDIKTEAWITWDEANLYFAFRSRDDNIWATMAERDQHLWEEEVVEVFLQPDPAQPGYIELEVNPLGQMLDIFLVDVRKPIPYESYNIKGLKWAVQVKGTVDGQPGDSEWTCEIALPLREAITAKRLPPAPGDIWRLNLYRVEAKPAKAGLAWSPTLKPDFHIPSRFGDLVFPGEAAK